MDEIYAGSGDDAVSGGTGNDFLGGGSGRDLLFYGNETEDWVIDLFQGTADSASQSDSRKSFEIIHLGSGNDTITGSQHNEELSGGDGKDILDGGGSGDLLIGGYGADIFVFTADFAKNKIADFISGHDRIDLTDLGLYDAGKEVFTGKSIDSIFDCDTQYDSHLDFEFDQTAIVLQDRQLAQLQESDFIL